MIHAEYEHEPDEPGITTVCGVPGLADNNSVSCFACIRKLEEMGMLHAVQLDILLVLRQWGSGLKRRHIYRQIETVQVKRELLG